MNIREMGTLYMLGYADPDTAAKLDRLMRQDRTLLVDIRYSPRCSFQPDWSRNALAARYGQRYRWARQLGNVHYNKRELGIQLAVGHEQAVARAADLLQQGVSL